MSSSDSVAPNHTDLPVPDKVRTSTRAMEMARIWIADGEQVVVLSANLWSDPAAWGLMLVDLAKHVAAAYESQGHKGQDVLKRIHEAFMAEWANPTDASAPHR